MPRRKVNQNYRSNRDGRWLGFWPAGQVVDVSDEDAEWVERDSPGTLSRVEPEPVASQPNPDSEPAKPARARKPAANRQHRGSQDRAS